MSCQPILGRDIIVWDRARSKCALRKTGGGAAPLPIASESPAAPPRETSKSLSAHDRVLRRDLWENLKIALLSGRLTQDILQIAHTVQRFSRNGCDHRTV